MYSSFSKGSALIVLMLINSVTCFAKTHIKTSSVNNINFSIQPQQCVTLRHGRDCFATLTVQWQRPTAVSLCLYQINKQQNNSQKQLLCWINKTKGLLEIEFESSENLTYQLRTQKDERVLAETEIVISWVHKNTSRKRHWRLF